jgi:hypothetical protein
MDAVVGAVISRARRVERRRMDDDIFEIEVTDLRAGPVPTPASAPPGAMPEHGAAAAQAWAPLSRPLGGPSPLATRRSGRGRLLAGAGAVLALTVALAVVLASAPGPRTALGRLFATPTATVSGADTFQVANGAPWGTLTADGRAINLNGFGYQPAIFHLAGGTHQLVFSAPPFPALRCRVSVPAAPADTCPLLTFLDGSFFPNGKYDIEGLRVLDLRATVDNLPPDAKQMLIAAAQALLNDARWFTTVQPGEHFRGADGTLRVAAGPLAATLALGLNLDPNSTASINGTTCVSICTLSEPVGPELAGGMGGWSLLASVTAHWRISAPDGTLIVPATPSPPDAPPPFTPLPLAATWHDGWQVAFASMSVGMFGPGGTAGNPATDAATQALCNLAQMAAGAIKTPSSNYGMFGWYGLAARPADGCVVVNQTTNVTQQLTGQPEMMLYRFGVLLAASALAHQLNPDLPVADASEQALARRAARASLPPQFATTG